MGRGGRWKLYPDDQRERAEQCCLCKTRKNAMAVNIWSATCECAKLLVAMSLVQEMSLDEALADLATVERFLATLPANAKLTRAGFESRRQELRDRIEVCGGLEKDQRDP